MKLVLISIGRLPWYRKGAPLFFFYTPRIGLPSLAAVTPPEWDVTILDGVQLEAVDFEEKVDLVGFSILTPFAPDSYRAAARFRERGVPVVMGGVHPSLMPEEAALHADAVVVGEGETVWPVVLRDVSRGALKPLYGGTPVDPTTLPMPRTDLIAGGEYCVANGLQLVRGCPFGAHCRFCTVPRVFGNRYRVVPVADAVERIRSLAAHGVAAGVNLSACCGLNYTAYIVRFAAAVTPLGIEWSGAALLQRLNDARLLRKLAAAGCRRVYTESAVPSLRKDPVLYRVYLDTVRKIQDSGMDVSYNFTVGFDEDTAEVYDEVESFIDTAALDRKTCAVQIFAPWPGTEEARRLEQEGRILDRDWSHYDNTRVVFRPRNMSVAELNRLNR